MDNTCIFIKSAGLPVNINITYFIGSIFYDRADILLIDIRSHQCLIIFQQLPGKNSIESFVAPAGIKPSQKVFKPAQVFYL